jgi:hypothetical protein
MNQDLIKLAECLAATLKDDNTIRKAAEEELSKLSQSTQEYLGALLQLISLTHPDITPQIKNSAAINLKKLVKETCDSASITKEQRLYFAVNIFSVLVSGSLDSSVRGSLGYALVPIFASQGEVLSAFQPTLISAMSSGTLSFLGSIKTIKSIYSGFVYNSILYPFFKKLLPSLIDIANKTLKSLASSIRDGDQSLAYEHCEILFEWSTCVNSILEYFDISSKQSLAEIKNIVELSEVFKDIIGVVIPEQSMTAPSIINITANSINIKLNQTKTQIFQCFNLIIQYLIENKKKIVEEESLDKVITSIGLDMPDSPFLNTISEIMPAIASSLGALLFHENFESFLESEYISEYLTELLLILNKLVTDNRFTEYFLNSFQHIIVNICFPLIKSTLSDIETFEESPEEFVALSSDICERQESETVKSTAAQFLEGICSKIDGSLKFLVEIGYEIIDWTITHKDLSSYPNLIHFSNSRILLASEELRIETALISICVVSYAAGKRSDLKKNIENLFRNHLNSLYTNGTGIIKNRLCMLVHYYCEYIFIEDENAFRSLLFIILNCCSPRENPIPSVNAQASETLSFMLQEEEIMIRIYSYIPEIMDSLIQLIPYQNTKSFFEALQEIITTNTSLILPHLSKLVPSLVEKVISQTSIKKTKKNKTSIIVVKCWNIIRALIECKELNSDQVLQLETQFIPLFEYIKAPKEIDFDDDIILFEVSVMRKCQIVTEVGWSIFTQLPFVQDKYDNTFVQLFQILNCYIKYGHSQLSTRPQYLFMISEMCGKCLFAVYKNKINEATNSEAALIYHQMLYTFKGQLNELLPSILAFAILKLTTVVKNDFFKARLLGVILAGFAYDSNQTLSILNTSQTSDGQTYFDYIFSEITKNSNIFKQSYDKKVAISGLSSFFGNPSLTEYLPRVFELMIEILGNSWNLSFRPDLKIDEETSLNSIKETLKDFNSEEMEASLGLTTYLTPLDTFDEYEYFRNLIKSLQQSDLSVLVKHLNKIQLQKLTEIVQSKKVIIGDNPAHTEVRRVLKPRSNKPS